MFPMRSQCAGAHKTMQSPLRTVQGSVVLLFWMMAALISSNRLSSSAFLCATRSRVFSVREPRARSPPEARASGLLGSSDGATRPACFAFFSSSTPREHALLLLLTSLGSAIREQSFLPEADWGGLLPDRTLLDFGRAPPDLGVLHALPAEGRTADPLAEEDDAQTLLGSEWGGRAAGPPLPDGAVGLRFSTGSKMALSEESEKGEMLMSLQLLPGEGRSALEMDGE